MKLIIAALTLTLAFCLLPPVEKHQKMSLDNIKTTNSKVIAPELLAHGAWFVEMVN